ncbi:MAG: hypothetical protein KA035_01340 [Candidatus Levybacteria bacterium]|nr:hypothetical protein [Candidatus Levybacteria bacterium]
MKKVITNAAFFAALYMLVVPKPAHAYLDPGTGSYILQIAAAALFGSLFALKVWWRQITGFISGIFGRKDNVGKHSSKDK